MSEVEVIKASKGRVTRHRDETGKAIILERERVAAYARVSTAEEEQIGSFRSQIQYYTDKINENPDWVLVKVYADEAITGTKSEKRPGFQEMIQDCMDGKIDLILTKSISRFARNTMDMLTYVRMLRDRNIGVFFEKENLDTLSMKGELMLTILSSLAQQDVETISSNVKMGLKMKMKHGELVGYNGCLGYDYHREDKTITLNEQGAETVRMIYDLYLQGYGTRIIAKRLIELGIPNKKGVVQWTEGGIRGILKNEKYKGDVLLGKTYTVDPLSKRRLENFGEQDQFYIKNHHEPIISAGDWERAQEIRRSRTPNLSVTPDGTREKYTRKYAFSSMCVCGFCGSKLSRRTFHCNSKYTKTMWYCMRASKKGKEECPNCKAIEEKMIEEAFLESYKLLADHFDDVLDSVLETVKEVASDDKSAKRLAQIKKDITEAERQRSRLTDFMLDGKITQEAYDEKYEEISEKVRKFVDEKENLEENIKKQKDIGKRMSELRTALQEGEILDEFDRTVFESVVEKVIVGEIGEDGTVDPYKLTFVLNGGGNLDHTLKQPQYRRIKRYS